METSVYVVQRTEDIRPSAPFKGVCRFSILGFSSPHIAGVRETHRPSIARKVAPGSFWPLWRRPLHQRRTCGYHHITTINEIFVALSLFPPGSLIVPLCEPSRCPCTRFSPLATVLIMRLFSVTPNTRANRDSSVSSHISCLFALNLVLTAHV